MKMEDSKFAQNCRKKGGVFKCCVSNWEIQVYEKTRNTLIEEGLLKGVKTSRMCKPESNNDPCSVCTLDVICTTKNVFTDAVKHTFYKGIKKHHQVGGKDKVTRQITKKS